MLSFEYVGPKTICDGRFLGNPKRQRSISTNCAEPNLTLHGSVPGIARGCNVPWGHLEESLVSTPLVKPCCSTAHWDPIEVLEGGYGHRFADRIWPQIR